MKTMTVEISKLAVSNGSQGSPAYAYLVLERMTEQVELCFGCAAHARDGDTSGAITSWTSVLGQISITG